MNLNEHQKWAITLAARQSFNLDLQHAGDGIFTEAGELVDAMKRNSIYGKAYDRVNLIEEVGDVLWYIALGADTLGLLVEDLPGPSEGSCDTTSVRMAIMYTAMSAGCVFADVCGVTIDDLPHMLDDLPQDLSNLLQGLCEIGGAFDFTLDEAADANYAKLIKRYPDKAFNAAHALNRDLEVERAALEGSVRAQEPVGAKHTLQ